jgi:hypothetical protein
MIQPHQDPVLAGALARVDVPPATGEFWVTLEARLAVLDGEGRIGADAPGSPPWRPASTAGDGTPLSSHGNGTKPVSVDRPRVPRHWTWRLASTAAALVLVAVVATAVVSRATVSGVALPPVAASPVEALDAYRRALNTGDRATAEALLGPRAVADLAGGKELPFQSLLATGAPPIRGGRVTWPDGWQANATQRSLTDNYSLVVVRPASLTSDDQGKVTQRPDSSYLITAVLWREGPEHRWLVEGWDAGARPNLTFGGPGGGIGSGNGLDLTMAIPEAGHAWLFVDDILHAEDTFPGPVWGGWRIPPVPATSSSSDDGREVVDVFIGPHLIGTDGFRFGGPR